MTKTRPKKKFKVGGIQVAIWENQAQNPQGGEDTYHSIKLERRYKDKSGSWKTADSLRGADLPKAILALSKAYEFVALKEVDPEDGGDFI